jgi:hypothetical protein
MSDTNLLTTTPPDRKDTYSAVGGMAVTPADALIVFPTTGGTFKRARPPRGFMVGDAGTVKVTLWDGSILTFVSGELALNVFHPMAVIQVWSTGTTATKFKVFW